MHWENFVISTVVMKVNLQSIQMYTVKAFHCQNYANRQKKIDI